MIITIICTSTGSIKKSQTNLFFLLQTTVICPLFLQTVGEFMDTGNSDTVPAVLRM